MRGTITIVVLGVDGEAELLDEEFTELGLALPGGEVQRGALVGVPHAGGHRGRALPLLVERGPELCANNKTNKSLAGEQAVPGGDGVSGAGAGDVLRRASRSPEHAASRKDCTLLRAAAAD